MQSSKHELRLSVCKWVSQCVRQFRNFQFKFKNMITLYFLFFLTGKESLCKWWRY